jgi:hypothetical protein
MKKQYFLILFLAAILFSCKKEKDEEQSIPTIPSSANAFITFSLPGQISSIVSPGAHTIIITMPFGVKLDTLIAATFTFSDKASVKIGAVTQTSGVTLNNFISPITYTITAENGTQIQDWIVTANYETYSYLSTDFPTAGKTFYMNIDSTNLTGYSIGIAGEGNVWNFTGLGVDDVDTLDFLNPAGQPGSAAFPEANIDIRDHNQTFDLFGIVSTNKVELTGLYGTMSNITLSVPSTNRSLFLTFPSEFGTQFLDDGSFQKDTTITYSGFPVTASLQEDIHTESEIDANGIVNTPIGSFKCIREHNLKILHTQVLVAGSPYFDQTDTTRTYNFYNKEKEYPVLSVEVDAAGNITKIKHQK